MFQTAIAKLLDVSAEEIKLFSDKHIFNQCNNSINAGFNNTYTFNTTESIEKLYQQIIQEKDSIIEDLRLQINLIKKS